MKNHQKTRKTGFVVPPMSTRAIHAQANVIRQRLAQLTVDDDWLPIDRIYEGLHLLIPEFVFEVCSEQEMQGDHGQTFPRRRLIKLREDVYDGMCSGKGRDRFTACHELGHLFLHGSDVALSRRAADSSVKIYRNSEWQADVFSSALLMPEDRLQACRSTDEVQERFGVSYEAAKARFKK